MRENNPPRVLTQPLTIPYFDHSRYQGIAHGKSRNRVEAQISELNDLHDSVGGLCIRKLSLRRL